MGNKKIFVLVPDGVGLRNFAYSEFYNKALARGFEVTFWNDTPFDISELGFSELKVGNSKIHVFTDVMKKARKEIELSLSIAKSGDRVYDSYRFKYHYKDLKTSARILVIKALTRFYGNERGLEKLRKKIASAERKTEYYRELHQTLQREKPDFLFSTTQRVGSAIAPILAAQDLNIPTGAFIFSWDNLPKATLDVEPDHYFVWSAHMKAELLGYYPFIAENQIIVSGTPQFEVHSDASKLISREEFFQAHGLDLQKKYICYSGDDVTTSPNDQLYLADVARAVRSLNKKGFNLGIIFRRCPVDHSNRFEKVLADNKDIITAIEPQWTTVAKHWKSILPTAEDLKLQMNTIAHTELVINLGSSMVFDYVAFGKPCAFVNYDYPIAKNVRDNWSVAKTYNFVHFRSMPSKDAVVWLNSAEEIESKIESMLKDSAKTVNAASEWFAKINIQPASDASSRILDAFETIINGKR